MTLSFVLEVEEGNEMGEMVGGEGVMEGGRGSKGKVKPRMSS